MGVKGFGGNLLLWFDKDGSGLLFMVFFGLCCDGV